MWCARAKRGFGKVNSTTDGGNTVILVAPDHVMEGKEVFSTTHIYECYKQFKTLGIKHFRLNEPSLYTTEFEPMDVLDRILTWSEAEKYRKFTLAHDRACNRCGEF